MRQLRLAKAKDHVFTLYPTGPQLGDSKKFLRIDIPTTEDLETRWLFTLEALAAEASIITNPVIEAEEKFRFPIDVLVRRPDGNYFPVLVTNHRSARFDPSRRVRVVATRRLGLGKPHLGNYRMKHHAVDSYTLALADRTLREIGLASSRGALVGQNHELAFILDTDLFQQGLQTAIDAAPPTEPHRVKECAHCRYWPICEATLRDHDDISLLFSGDKGTEYKRQGVVSVEKLAREGEGTDAILARAYQRGIELMRRQAEVTAPRFDVEIDIDVEAYLDHGAYLWGAYDGQHYRAFVTWNELDSEHEARNFAEFWSWLSESRAAAKAAGKTVGVFCFSAHGENHWLRTSAQRFFGRYPGVPSEAEIIEFISSEEWIDVFTLVKKQLLGTRGLGLKTIAPAAGFRWEEEELDGEASINRYLVATGAVLKGDVLITTSLIDAQRSLLSYNGDDCRATAAVRRFLSQGAPGLPLIDDI